MANKPFFENRPGTDVAGLQSALVRYFEQLQTFLDQNVADATTTLQAEVDALQANPGIPPVSLRGFRTKDQAGAYSSGVTRTHVAGMHGSPATYYTQVALQNMQGMGAGQMAYVVPEYFERGGVISRLVTKTAGTTGNGGTPRLRLGVYADGTLASGVLTGSPYPGERIGQSAIIDVWGGGGNRILETADLTIAVAAGTRVWFAIMFNAQAVTNQHQLASYQTRSLFPFLGFTFTSGSSPAVDSTTSAVAWRHAVTFGTTEDCPSPFPQTAPVLLADTSDIPLIGFGSQLS